VKIVQLPDLLSTNCYNADMKKLLVLGIAVVVVLVWSGVAKAQIGYNPDAFNNQVSNISNYVNYDDWGAANPQYEELAQLCQEISSQYPNLTSSAQLCVTGSNLVIAGSGCGRDCRPTDTTHTTSVINGIPYNVTTTTYPTPPTGSTVDRGLQDINQAAKVLQYFN